MDAVYEAPQAVQAMKLSLDVLSMSSRKMRVRLPNVTVNRTRNPVSSFCPNEKRNNMTHAGSGIFLHNDAQKRIIMGRKKPRFVRLAESRAKMSATKVARTVLLMATRHDLK